MNQPVVLAPETPTLWPGMLLPRRWPHEWFPFGASRARYTYLARNGIYALARQWGLAGKEVLFPAYFHGVELQALLAAGVRPRFFPVSSRMRVEPAEIANLIRAETAGVYLIHYLGFPGPVAAIAEVCRERGLFLIEDCALSLLSSHQARPLGTFGDAAIFCLYKSLPTLHGGVAVLRSGERLLISSAQTPPLGSTLAHLVSFLLTNLIFRQAVSPRSARRLRRMGRALKRRSDLAPAPTGTNTFDVGRAGLLMSSVCRGIISAQRFAQIVRVRRRNFLQLAGELGRVAPSVVGELPEGTCPLSYPFVTPHKEAMWARLRARGVEAVNFWSLHHPLVPVGMFPEVDALRATVLEIPCHQDLTPPLIERVAHTVRAVAAEVT